MNIGLISETSLNPNHPIYSLTEKVFFIWDIDVDLHSFKKLVFLYESLLETKATLLKGSFEKTLDELIESFKPETLYVTEGLSNKIDFPNTSVLLVEDVKLLSKPLRKKPKRFFQFWKEVRSDILKVE